MKVPLTLITAMLSALPATFVQATPATEPVTNSIGITLVRIEPGTFTMGQDGPPLENYVRNKPFGEIYKDIYRIDFDEKPAHRVTLTRPILMGVTEVTVVQFRRFDPAFKTTDPRSQPPEDHAASGLTWERAAAFCEWLSKREGTTYRLPTEAEWEYACRAGTTTLFHTGDTLPDAHQKWIELHPAKVPFFDGPKPFVRIADGPAGSVFRTANHSRGLTECPNGDLLAVWFSSLSEVNLTTSNAGFSPRTASPTRTSTDTSP